MGGRTVRRMNCAAFHFSTITGGKAFVVNPLVLSSSFMMRHMERLHFSTLPSLKPHVWLMVAATQSVLLSVQQTSPLTQEPDYKRERGVCVFLCVHMCRNTHRWSSNDQRFRRRERKWILRAGGGLVLRHISPTHFLRWCRTLVPPPHVGKICVLLNLLDLLVFPESWSSFSGPSAKPAIFKASSFPTVLFRCLLRIHNPPKIKNNLKK